LTDYAASGRGSPTSLRRSNHSLSLTDRVDNISLGSRRTGTGSISRARFSRSDSQSSQETCLPLQAGPSSSNRMARTAPPLTGPDSAPAPELLTNSELGSRWLKEQSKLVRRKITAPSVRRYESDEESLGSDESSRGDLALVKDARGRKPSFHLQSAADPVGYYYSYENADTISLATRSEVLPDQVSGLTSYRPSSIGSSLRPPPSDYPPEPILSPDCSACGTRLVYMRYVCLDCGEADMWKENERSKTHYGISETGHSDGSGETAMIPLGNGNTMRPRSESTSTHTSRGSGLADNGKERQVISEGYELCPGCIEVHGLEHARSSASSQPGQSLRISETRHTFREKIWGSHGWQDVGKYPPISDVDTAEISRIQRRYTMHHM
jgi:hypothetical protein